MQSSDTRKAARARRRELCAEELRDAGEPAEWRAYSAGRSTERDAVRFRAALPGLHLTVASDPSCSGTNHRSDAPGNERSSDAAETRGRKVARSMRRHHRCESVSRTHQKISKGILRAGQETV